jgi:hypothetical protein
MKEQGSFRADPTAKVDPTKDLTEENKAEWLKRRAKEDRKHKAGMKVLDEWFEIVQGKKLVKKIRKNNGGLYSLYICNVKKVENKGVLAALVKGADGKYRQKASAR